MAGFYGLSHHQQRAQLWLRSGPCYPPLAVLSGAHIPPLRTQPWDGAWAVPAPPAGCLRFQAGAQTLLFQATAPGKGARFPASMRFNPTARVLVSVSEFWVSAVLQFHRWSGEVYGSIADQQTQVSQVLH